MSGGELNSGGLEGGEGPAEARAEAHRGNKPEGGPGAGGVSLAVAHIARARRGVGDPEVAPGQLLEGAHEVEDAVAPAAALRMPNSKSA